MSRPIQDIIVSDPNFLSSKGLVEIISKHSHLNLAHTLQATGKLDNYASANLIIFNLIKDDKDSLKLIKLLISKNDKKILVIVDEQNITLINELWKLRPSCIITNECSESEIGIALEMLSTNQRYYNSNVLDIITAKENTLLKSDSPLSFRELQVIKLISKGKPTEKIANELHVSVHTINSHRKNIMKKLGFNSPVQLIVYAVKNDLIE